MQNEIVVLTGENFPYGGPGANYLRNFTTGIHLNSKYNIWVWLQSGNSRPDDNFQKARKNSINGVNYKFIGFSSLRPTSVYGKIIDDFIGTFNSIYSLLKERRHIKVFIVYNNSSIGTIGPLLICKTFNIKTIKIIPEWYEKSSVVTSRFKYFKWWDFIIGMTRQNFLYDGLIVLSSYLKNYYTSNGYPEKKLFVLPNLVNFEEFSDFQNQHTPDKIIIGYSGTPVKKDGILDLLKAFSFLIKTHRKVMLLIIGDISQTKTTLPYLRVKATDFGIPENNIHFTGLVDFKHVSKLLHACDILVLARPAGRFSEAGFPTKLGEYFACKKPVVLTKVGDIPKYLVDKENAVLVEPDNPESISMGLKFLIDNPDKAENIGRRGYDWAKYNLEYKSVTANVLKFLDKDR